MTNLARDESDCWLFDFGLETGDGRPLSYKEAESFFNTLLELAESKGLQIGGGFRKGSEEDEASLQRLSKLLGHS